jgi:hypothetical protein
MTAKNRYQNSPGDLIAKLISDILNNYNDADKYQVLKAILQLRTLKTISGATLAAKIDAFKAQRIMFRARRIMQAANANPTQTPTFVPQELNAARL